MHFESFSINEGLSQGFISGIFQDKKGLMWFATGDGLNKFDGYTFKNYHHDQDDSTSLSSDDLTCVFEDSKGRLWIGTRQSGIDLFDRKKNRFHHITSTAYNSLRSDNIIGITEDKKGALWIRSQAGIDRLDIFNGTSQVLLNQGGSLWQEYTILFSRIQLDSIFESEKHKYGPEEIFIDSQDRIFLTTNNRLWEVTYQANQHTYQLIQRFSYPVSDSGFIPMLLEDTVNHDLLLNFKQIIRFHGYDFNAPETIFKSDPLRVRWTIDKAERIWLADKGGITQVHLKPVHTRQIISANPVQMQALAGTNLLFTDRTGVVWIGTGGYGLLKFDPEIELFHHSLENTVIYQLIPGDSGKIINNHFQELTIRKNTVLRVTNLIDSSIIKTSFPKLSVMSFTKDTTGNLWIGIHGGILMYSRKTKILTRFNLPYTDFVSLPFPIYADNRNYIWMGYNRHFVRYNLTTGEFKRFPYPTQSISYEYDFLQNIYEDGKFLWLGSTKGLFCFDMLSENWRQSYAFDPGNNHSLSNNIVLSFSRDFHQPGKYLWVGTKGGGLNRLDKTTGIFTRYDTHDGLPNNFVYGILTDKEGNLWLSTNKGLSTMDVATHTFRNFDVKDGLQSNEFNRYAYTKTEDGLLVFGGMNGLNYFDPRELKPLKPPEVVLTDFRLFNRPVNLETENSGIPANIESAREIILRYEQNVATLQFAGTDYRKQGNLQYRYKMEGFDQDWIYAGAVREATYTNLDPGRYTFLVQSSFKNARWGPKITSLRIVVLPPWYRTWWFYVALVTVITSSFLAAYRYRQNQLKNLEKLRNRIARDLHDELGSSISTIAIYSRIAHEQSGSETFDSKPLLKKITDYTTEIMESMNDIVWNINTKHDEFEEIINRMREHAYHMLEPRGYTIHFLYDDAVSDEKLNMEKRRDFYLIYKEALNNVAKYANGKNVWITLTLNHNLLTLSIKDDGKGFDPESVRQGGNGLTNMHYRASTLKGTIKITSKRGKGTEIALAFSAGR